MNERDDEINLSIDKHMGFANEQPSSSMTINKVVQIGNTSHSSHRYAKALG